MTRKNDRLPLPPLRHRTGWRARHWIELYAWLLAGLIANTLVHCGGDGFDAGSVWHLVLGVIALAAIRTGLLGWVASFQRRRED